MRTEKKPAAADQRQQPLTNSKETLREPQASLYKGSLTRIIAACTETIYPSVTALDSKYALSTVSLIGMPGVGKSTVGVILAKLLGLDFLDTDLSIQAREQRSLQEILDSDGYLRLRDIEERVLLEVPIEMRVVATGGSVVYSDAAMQRLKRAGTVIYLAADIQTLKDRVATNPERGIASAAGLTFEDIYAERTPKYEHYADYSVTATNQNADEVAQTIGKILLAQND
ncbi:MAG: shikimate kinase [Pseudomonadota bacterium]